MWWGVYLRLCQLVRDRVTVQQDAYLQCITVGVMLMTYVAIYMCESMPVLLSLQI